jgi:hypothetical protein
LGEPLPHWKQLWFVRQSFRKSAGRLDFLKLVLDEIMPQGSGLALPPQ